MHPVGGALFHPHLPEIKVFQLFVRIICWLMCSVYLCFCNGFDCIIILKFCLYCVLSCCVRMHYYVSWLWLALFLCMWLYVYCSGAEELLAPESTHLQTFTLLRLQTH